MRSCVDVRRIPIVKSHPKVNALNISLTRNAVINASYWNVLSNYNCCSDFNRATLDLYNWLQLRVLKYVNGTTWLKNGKMTPTYDITVTLKWALRRLKSPAYRLFAQSSVQAQMKENIKAPHYWPFWGESTGDRRIALTKGQQRGKCFHLLTSSWQLPYRITLVSFTSEIIEQIIQGGDKPLRPHQPALEEEQPAGAMALVERCWEEDPQKRPDFSEIRARVRDFNKGKYVLRMWFFVSCAHFLMARTNMEERIMVAFRQKHP